MSSVPPKSQQPASERPASDRRSADRIDVTWSVDCETEDTFLYANITNISEVGIFVRTNEPLEVGTRISQKCRRAPPVQRDWRTSIRGFLANSWCACARHLGACASRLARRDYPVGVPA